MFRQEVLGFLVTLPEVPYTANASVEQTAMRNELVRMFKDGLAKSLTFIFDDIKANEAELQRLKES